MKDRGVEGRCVITLSIDSDAKVLGSSMASALVRDAANVLGDNYSDYTHLKNNVS